jgi:hypothetical protein
MRRSLAAGSSSFLFSHAAFPVSIKERQMPDAESRGPVVRVSRGKFDPGRFAEVREMMMATSSYLIPAIRQLPGLISYFAGASPDGSMVNVSVWETGEHAAQMGALKEMMVDARRDAAAVGVEFINVVNYPIAWTI